MMVPPPGSRINLGDDLIAVVEELVLDDNDTPAAMVVALDNGRWAAIPLSDVEISLVTVH